jgi:hypothetical protein
MEKKDQSGDKGDLNEMEMVRGLEEKTLPSLRKLR